MSSRLKLNFVAVLCLALLILESAIASTAQNPNGGRTVKSFISQNKEGNSECPSAEVWKQGTWETKLQVKKILFEYLNSRSPSMPIVTVAVTQPKTTQEQTTEQNTESPASGQTDEQNIESSASGQTDEQKTESPASGQTDEQSTESSMSGQTDEQNIESSASGQTDEQNTESPGSGQTDEQSTESPASGQTDEQNTESPTSTLQTNESQTTEESTELPTSEQNTEQSSTQSSTSGHMNTELSTRQTTDSEQNMSTTIDPSYICHGKTAQLYEAKTLKDKCGTSNSKDVLKFAILQDIGPQLEQLCNESVPGETSEPNVPIPTEPPGPCGGPGWRQVVFINMTDPSYNCPPGFRLTSHSKRTCARSQGKDCSSTTFSVGGSKYSRVCGRLRGYQIGGTCAFVGYNHGNKELEKHYVDGASLTHGPIGGRQHIWTFAGGLSEISQGYSYCQCPCDDTRASSPDFVGDDYFCESGLHSVWSDNEHTKATFLDDPLWDGKNCTSTSTCCQHKNPPWFTKTLPNPTSDDIELRLCRYTIGPGPSFHDAALELVEIYVH